MAMVARRKNTITSTVSCGPRARPRSPGQQIIPELAPKPGDLGPGATGLYGFTGSVTNGVLSLRKADRWVGL